MLKIRILAIVFIALGVGLGLYVYQSEQNGSNPFRLGLDLQGGSYLVYKADISAIDEGDIGHSMDSLRDVIERRINAFGVAEPNVNTETNTLGVEDVEYRLVVELPGVTNLDEAVEMIGQTPLLEFKVEAPEDIQNRIQEEVTEILSGSELEEAALVRLIELENERYIDTGLTGKYLQKSQLQFSQGSIASGGSFQSTPIVTLSFDNEGGRLFEQITRDNLGKTIAIYLDGEIVSAPRVNSVISGGQAIIEGNFTVDEAKTTVTRLNSGALPIPIELISTNTIGPTLGHEAVEAGIAAGVLGFILISIIMVLWYRLPGLIAIVALGIYTALMLWIFKFLPITLTSAGITGFIISIGIAVDANILIFERMGEEMKKGSRIYEAVAIGFNRAWDSIRDANFSSLLATIFLFWFGTTLIKGFALVFGIGILISMLTAITFTRSFLLLFLSKEGKDNRIMRFLYQNGVNK